MSTSSKFQRRNGLRPGRRHWVAGVAAAIALALTLIWINAAGQAVPELRVGRTGDTLSAQIVDGRQVILIANAEGPTDARAAIGILRRPWDRDPSVIIADARDTVAAGLWETLQRESPDQLTVLGAPGDSDAWLQIERYCRDAGIEIRYLETSARLELDTLTVTLVPAVDGSHALISDGTFQVALSLGGLPESGRYHALIATDDLPAGVSADVQILAGASLAPGAGQHVRVEDGRRVTLAFGQQRLGVQGGELLDASRR